MTQAGRSSNLLLIVMIFIVTSYGQDMEVWQRSCPFNDFCTQKRMDTLNKTANPTKEPCCQSCSCEEDCWVFENCCPDVVHQPPVGLQKANCMYMGNNNNYTSSISLSPRYNYRVIDFCPRDYGAIDQRMVDRCKGRFVSDLDDFVAVSDRNDIIYKNKYCALCHGVRDVVSWKLRLSSCSYDLDLTKVRASEYTAAILNQCMVYSDPPNDAVQHQIRLCGLSTRSDCQLATDIGKSDLVGNADYCRNGPSIPFLQKRFSLQVYKNVFCYLCRYGNNKQDVCSSLGDDLKKSDGLTFDMLLDMSLSNGIRAHLATLTPFRCNESEIYDHVKGNCTRIFCPQYSVVFFGRCLPMAVSFSNYGVRLRIQFKQTHTKYSFADISGNELNAAKAYMGTFLQENGLGHCTVTKFVLAAYFEKKTDILVFIELDMSIKFNDKCDVRFITQLARTRLSKNVDTSVVINSKEVFFSGRQTFYVFDQLDFSEPYDQTKYKKSFFVTIYNNGVSRLYDEVDNRFFLCPYFLINIHQYHAITAEVFGREADRDQTKTLGYEQLEEGFYALSNNNIAVCVDTYFDIYSKNSACTTQLVGSLIYEATLVLTMFILTH